MSKGTDSKRYTVYKHKNNINGKVYIGITSTSLEKRFGKNGANYRKNTFFYRAIEKYGWDAFSHEIIADGMSLEDAAKTEVALISKYNSTNPQFGYNISDGGESGHSGCHMTVEERTKRSEMMRGNNNPCFGKYGAEHPAYGCKHSDESKSAVSIALTGRDCSAETRKIMSDYHKALGNWRGEKNPMSGKKYGAAPQARMVTCIETGEVFDSVKRAADYVGTFPTSITAACSGRQQTCKGFHWKYTNDLEVSTRAS